MMQAANIYLSARTQIDRLALRQVSAIDLLEEHVARYEQVNGAINAIIRTDLPRARQRALELDRMLATGRSAGPLHGLPITIKDTFDAEGLPASAGAREYARRPLSCQDAASVALLRAAGAVIWGKTNTPYLAGDSQTNNLLYGRTSNPWDLSRTPGGSSGGAAAALAAGLTPLELGSDIGGSLRLPAHFCGISALKPSFGAVPISGHVPPAPGSLAVRDLNVAGPMARDVADLRLMFQILSGQPAITRPRATSLRAGRIAIWPEDRSLATASVCRSAVAAAADAAADAGAQVLVAKPDIDGAGLLDLYLRLLLPILASDMPAPLVRALQAGRPLAKLMARGEPFGRAKWAAYSAASHHDWLQADEARRRLKRSMAEFFSRWRALITPVAPTTAFAHRDTGDAISRQMEVDGQPIPYHMFHGWIALASVCHLPAVVIPIPSPPGALPCGVQIIGPEGGDMDVLAIAEALEGQLGGFRQPPEAAMNAALSAGAGKPSGLKLPLRASQRTPMRGAPSAEAPAPDGPSAGRPGKHKPETETRAKSGAPKRQKPPKTARPAKPPKPEKPPKPVKPPRPERPKPAGKARPVRTPKR